MKLMGNRRLQINVSISGSVTSQNIRTLAGNPTVACDVTCTVNAGANVHSTNSATPALRVGTGWVAGSTFKIINNGSIHGEGGGGGSGGVAPVGNGGAGNAGSNAVDLDGFATSIDNTNGYIFAGGGGGGGGGAGTLPGMDGGSGGTGQGFSGDATGGSAGTGGGGEGGGGAGWGTDGFSGQNGAGGGSGE
jgi:hypothetical protein